MWKKYLKIREAAEFLGVSQQTLRNWDKNDKLVSFRHPVNHYRLYRITDLERFLLKIDKNKPRKLKVKILDN